MTRTHQIYSIQAALLAALLCLLSPHSLWLGPIPLTLATCGIYITAALLPPLYAAEAVGLYLLLGLCGLPVFSGFGAGVAVLLGPTGGFLIGYLPAVILASYLLKRHFTWFTCALALTAATAVIYACGVLWYMHIAKMALLPTLAVCILPFLPADALKIAAATALCTPLRKALRTTK